MRAILNELPLPIRICIHNQLGLSFQRPPENVSSGHGWFLSNFPPHKTNYPPFRITVLCKKTEKSIDSIDIKFFRYLKSLIPKGIKAISIPLTPILLIQVSRSYHLFARENDLCESCSKPSSKIWTFMMSSLEKNEINVLGSILFLVRILANTDVPIDENSLWGWCSWICNNILLACILVVGRTSPAS